MLAGRQNRAQGGVAPSAPSAHPLAAVLGDILEATRSLAESVSVLVCCFFPPSTSLPTQYLQIVWFRMLKTRYRQARRRRFGPPWRRRMILLPIALLGLRTLPHHSCRGCDAGRYVKSFHLFGWRVCLALPGCHLHVVHGVSTPLGGSQGQFLLYILRTYEIHSRGETGDVSTERISRASPSSASLGVLRLAVVGAT
jgi:hypothetical protein